MERIRESNQESLHKSVAEYQTAEGSERGRIISMTSAEYARKKAKKMERLPYFLNDPTPDELRNPKHLRKTGGGINEGIQMVDSGGKVGRKECRFI